MMIRKKKFKARHQQASASGGSSKRRQTAKCQSILSHLALEINNSFGGFFLLTRTKWSASMSTESSSSFLVVRLGTELP